MVINLLVEIYDFMTKLGIYKYYEKMLERKLDKKKYPKTYRSNHGWKSEND